MSQEHSTSPRIAPGRYNLEGRRFGRLLVLRRSVTCPYGGWYWTCECDCGTVKDVVQPNLIRGKTRSCGCVRAEMRINRNKTHGLSGTPEYNIWFGMKQRCGNPNDGKYPDYGGRGIFVCERWISSFETFYKDMGPRPSPKHSINRIDNDGPYVPDNCEWALPKTQANNSRRNHIITRAGESRNLQEWADDLGLNRNMIAGRLRRGEDIESALAPPSKARRLEYDGRSMTIRQWAEYLGLRHGTFRARLKLGWSMARAVKTPYRCRKPIVED